MAYKIVEIENSNNLRLFLNNLIIFNRNNKITIPLEDIDTLIINNYKINLSSQLLIKIANYNINLIICDLKHLPLAFIVPIVGNFNTVKIFEKQLNWTKEFKGQNWTKIVTNKMKNQLSLLTELFSNDKTTYIIDNLIKSTKIYDPTNHEGQVAKIYWARLFGNDFKRTDDSNFINSVLNYGYTVLNSLIARSIVKKGLDGRIALFHKSYNNFFALASDLIEPFRPVIDIFAYVIKNKLNSSLISIPAIKDNIIKMLLVKVSINNRAYFLNNAIDIMVDSLIKNSLVTIKINFRKIKNYINEQL